MDFINNFLSSITEYAGYVFGFFSYLFESAKGLLVSGNVVLFVLFLIIIWKTIAKLKG